MPILLAVHEESWSLVRASRRLRPQITIVKLIVDTAVLVLALRSQFGKIHLVTIFLAVIAEAIEAKDVGVKESRAVKATGRKS